MSMLRLKFVQSFGAYHYFRRRGSPRIRLPGLVGSSQFMQAYQAALAAAPVPIGAAKRSGPGSVSAAIASYYESRAFKSFEGVTQAQRRAMLERFREDNVIYCWRRCRKSFSPGCSTPCLRTRRATCSRPCVISSGGASSGA
jgi:hypothetical protein